MATGLVCSVVLAVFLWINRSLSQFVDYYRIFGPGHAASGTLPPIGVTQSDYVLFAISSGLVVLTIWSVSAKLIGRQAWSPRDWVTVAAAILTGLYGEKAIARFDGAHVLQSVAVSVPLWIMWAAPLLEMIEAQIHRFAAKAVRWRPTTVWLRQPATIVILVVAVLGVPAIQHTVWHSPGDTKQVAPSQTNPALVGYSSPTAIDPKLLSDLRTIIDTYAGAKGKIFDFTNSMGYYYYLLQRDNATSFVSVSMAESEYSQKIVIDQLAKSKPALVTFDDDDFGLPVWDGPRNEVRHFQISQYLLDGWTPILRSHSVLFMVRNDLLAGAPSVPALSEAPQTTDLYSSSPTCDFGDTANFLESKPTSPSVTLPVTSLGNVEQVSVRGWAFDPVADEPVKKILVTVGDQVASQVDAAASRPDVAAALRDPRASESGYQVSLTSKQTGTPGVYALLPDGLAHPVGSTVASAAGHLTRPDGSQVSVSNVAASGSIDTLLSSHSALSSVTIPRSATFDSYQLATFSAGLKIGDSVLDLTDQAPLAANAPSGGGSEDIVANVIPNAGSSIAIRVGSCLQWHGYQGKTLYFLQTGGTPISRVLLSGVRD